MHKMKVVLILILLVVMVPATIAVGEDGQGFPLTFLAIAIILLAAQLSRVVEKLGQPSVLGELLIGVVLGNLILVGIPYLEFIKQDNVIAFLAQLGVVILLFQVGLGSNVKEMKKVGVRAAIVALIGVILPFILGTFVIGPWLIRGLSFHSYLFLGAALTATSAGITARVFKDLDKLHMKEAQIVLGAAVIDDVLGLIILAVVSAIVSVGTVNLGMISWIFVKAMLFLLGSVIIGQLIAPKLSDILSKIDTGIGAKFTVAISFCLVFAYLANLIGLAPIVGAFAAGLVLDAVHFGHFRKPEIVEQITKKLKGVNSKLCNSIKKTLRDHSRHHVEDIIEPVGFFLIPIFFVTTGISVKLETLFNLPVLFVALAITLVAVIGKVFAGFFAGKVNKILVGFAMVPRGEVALILATMGKAMGVIPDALFSIIVIVVILTTLMTPPILNFLLKKDRKY